MSDTAELIRKAQAEIAALELRADGLLHVLAGAASRPLDETANIMLETTNTLAQLQKYMSALEPTLAGLSYQPPPAAAIEAQWRMKETDATPGGLLAGPASGAQTLPALLASINSLPGLQLSLLEGRRLVQHPEAATLLRLCCGPSVTAVVQLAQPGSMLPLRVALFAPQEEAEAAAVWPWGQSRHLVFRRASGVAAAALRHFSAAALAGQLRWGEIDGGGGGQQPTVIEMLLLWLATYSDLFSRPSSATGALLAADPQDGLLLPPLLRPYRNLSWSQLRAAAADPSHRAAYHTAAEEDEAARMTAN